MVKLLKMWWYSFILGYHLRLAIKINRTTKEGRIESDYRYLIASQYYEKM